MYSYAVSEPYARHGYVFKDDELRACYERFDWYEKKDKTDKFWMDLFNDIGQKMLKWFKKNVIRDRRVKYEWYLYASCERSVWKDELEKLLRADPKYIYDENHNYKYATNSEKMNMRDDEIDPISYAKLIDGIKLYDFFLKNNKTIKSKFEVCVVECIQDMVHSDNPIEIYFAARITYILYTQ